jgi:hypothetical protein
MDGINQSSLFSHSTLRIDVVVLKENRFRVLAERIPWIELAEIANFFRSKKININNGRPLNLRLHIGAKIAQNMNGWTDRETEEMVAHHAGVRLLCGLEQSSETIDHTSIQTFRSQIGSEGEEALNGVIVRSAKEAGFTDGELCASDTTVQESPIAYPTEVGHIRNIGRKLVGIGSKLKKGISNALKEFSKEAQDIFEEIRLFTRGKKEKAIQKKKDLSKKLLDCVKKMQRLVEEEVGKLGSKSKEKITEELNYYKTMLSQCEHWIKTGFHRPGKYLSLWEKNARAITRDKCGKATEFGRRWFITRLTAGYMIGAPCERLGSDTDANLMPEVVSHYKRILGENPKLAVFDRGGDGDTNHKFLKKNGIINGIFRKGKESLIGLGRNTRRKVRRERALTEAAIATIKHPRYGFTKPRARSSETIVLKGHSALFGANLTRFAKDWVKAMAPITE